jgi:molybdate transport repressor ModE-like protein
MLKVHIRPHWEISFHSESPLDTAALLALLLAVHESGAIATAARTVGLSYRYAWGLLREAERLFGEKLIDSERGRGTQLTPLAQKLVWADHRIAARLSPTLESLASELESELSKLTLARLRTIRMDASHGFAVATLTGYLNRIELPVELRYRTCTDALSALARRDCDLAGFHTPEGKFEQRTIAQYLRWLDPQQHRLVHIARREQGLMVARDNPLGVKGLADLARAGVRCVNRQVGSGTRMLLEMMLQDAGIGPDAVNGYNSAEFTHSAVAAYIASGMADVGIGMRIAAEQFKLGFIPLAHERYFFALNTEALEDRLMARVLAVLRDPAYHQRVAALPGYDAAHTGRVEALDEAFPDVAGIGIGKNKQ